MSNDKYNEVKESIASNQVVVIGGGLAGSEAAWQLAQRSIKVKLFEMRPKRMTGAHVSNRLAELVCSNSLGSKLHDRATGMLQQELKMLGSLLLHCAEQAKLPAGGALAVDRELFATLVTDAIQGHDNIEIVREEVTSLPEDAPVIVATGPLTSEALAQDVARITGQEYLYFYDALSPIVSADSIDMSVAFRGNRYDRGETDEGDYINCPLNKDEYLQLVNALREAETIELRNFEREDPNFFEGCVPVEQLAIRGDLTLAFGPMRPIGLTNPHTGQRPYAVVQLRQDDLAGSLYNIVGFQTNIRWGAQAEVLRLIPGLENADFVRMGQMHRNTFINAPVLLHPTMQFKRRQDLYFGGQITGVEGYVGNIATGLVAALNMARQLHGLSAWIPPRTTMLGALCYYVTHTSPEDFQPMKANFGILPELEVPIKSKSDRKAAYSARGFEAMKRAVAELDNPVPSRMADTESLTN